VWLAAVESELPGSEFVGPVSEQEASRTDDASTLRIKNCRMSCLLRNPSSASRISTPKANQRAGQKLILHEIGLIRKVYLTGTTEVPAAIVGDAHPRKCAGITPATDTGSGTVPFSSQPPRAFGA